jgi:hypothetical protein
LVYVNPVVEPTLYVTENPTPLAIFEVVIWKVANVDDP